MEHDTNEPVETVTCETCKGRSTHTTKRDHPQGAGIEVACSGCNGTGVRTRRRDSRGRAGERVARFG